MKITIENIGIIRHADIRLDGLTIIAGENDTGKSTVGKLMFSLVKAFSRYEQDLKEKKSDRVFSLIEKIYFRLRGIYNLNNELNIKNEFYPPKFIKELQDYPENITENISRKAHILKLYGYESGIRDLKLIEKIYLEKEQKSDVIKRALEKALISEFYSELSPKNSHTKSSVELLDGLNNINNHVFSIEIENDSISNLSFSENLFLNDATYIETPILLQMGSLIISTPTLFERDNPNSLIRKSSKVSLHAKDLLSKMQEAQYYLLDDDVSKNLLEEIGKTTKGIGFYFEKRDRDFYFEKDNITKFRASNTATGLKSFGVIQLLAQAGFLNERSLLIIDEPEIHLHPKWQIEYARLIAILVKNGVPVLVTSHSPEIIQALTVFSEYYKIDDKTNYYLAESDGTSSEIVNVTKNINKIFIKLTTPLSNLMGGFYHAR